MPFEFQAGLPMVEALKMNPIHKANDVRPLGSPHLLVIGDVILDRYTWGDADRVSPEAPVLVLKAGEREIRLGGAASVATLASGLGATVTLAGLLGDDSEGRTLTGLLRDEGINPGLLRVDSDRPTTVKERFIGRAAGRHPHQILRVDCEATARMKPSQVAELSAAIEETAVRAGALLIADYAKGVCAPELIRLAIHSARTAGIPVLVDPARGVDVRAYRGSTLIKPNRREAELALGRSIDSISNARGAAAQLCALAEARAVLLTLDRDGMVLWEQEIERAIDIPTTPRDVYDITGAGDMVLAALGIAIASGWPLCEAARFANVAAGIEIEQWGIAAVPRERVLIEFRAMDPRRSKPADYIPHSLVSLDEAASLAQMYRERGLKIVFTNGCFDLLHAGHVACLEQAAGCGDVLFVGTNSDDSVRRLKGPSRPVIPERQRAQMLASLRCVDHVVIFDEPTPEVMLRRIRPDVLVKGGNTSEIVGREIVEAYGGRVCSTCHIEGISTTQILSAMASDGRESVHSA